MKGLGHFPMSEDPQAFLKHLLPVLEKIANIAFSSEVGARSREENALKKLVGRSGGDLFVQPRRRQVVQRLLHLGHGGAAIVFALLQKTLLVRAEIRDAGLDFVLVFAAQRRCAICAGFGGCGLPIASASIASMSGMVGDAPEDRRWLR